MEEIYIKKKEIEKKKNKEEEEEEEEEEVVLCKNHVTDVVNGTPDRGVYGIRVG